MLENIKIIEVIPLDSGFVDIVIERDNGIQLILRNCYMKSLHYNTGINNVDDIKIINNSDKFINTKE